jgi:hypothetical protein
LCGLTPRMLDRRIGPDGPWQRLLPGVYLTHTGMPSRDQQLMAALCYAGDGAIITGLAALAKYGVRAPETQLVDVLVPHTLRRTSREFVVLHRTRQVPRLRAADGPIRYVAPARAVADAAAGLTRLGSPAEGDFRDLVRRGGLPPPLFNARLYLGPQFLAVPDAWWPQAGVAAEVDSRAWHLSPDSWEQTMLRHARMTAAGVLVLHFSPRQVRAAPGEVIAAIAAALRAGRPIPAITARPAGGGQLPVAS